MPLILFLTLNVPISNLSIRIHRQFHFTTISVTSVLSLPMQVLSQKECITNYNKPKLKTKYLRRVRRRTKFSHIQCQIKSQPSVSYIQFHQNLSNTFSPLLPEEVNRVTGTKACEDQCSLLQAILACREEGVAPARGPGICAALEYAVPLPPKPGILSEVI